MEIITGSEEQLTIQSPLFTYPGPLQKLMVSVIVPVKNESAHLVQTLDALRLQEDENGCKFDQDLYEVLLLANNCTDDSFAVARQYQISHRGFHLHIARVTLQAAVANIGTARCLLMDAACNRLLSINSGNGIIASTDGDTEVDPRWILNIICEIGKGNDAVGGRIITRRFSTATCKYYLQNERYRSLVSKAESIADPLDHDPWPRHFQYFGANLAVTCRMYRKVGGLPQLPWLEDEAFHNALIRQDAKIRKSVKVKVTTSDRQEGRVAIGFSQQLREWAEMKKLNQPQLVTSAEELIVKFTCRQKLRSCWTSYLKFGEYDQQVFDNVAKTLCLKDQWLKNELTSNRYFGKLWETVEAEMSCGEWSRKWQPVRINVAINKLKNYTAANLFEDAPRRL